MDVLLFDRNDNLIVEYPLFIGLFDAIVTARDYAVEGKRQAIADKLVSKEDARHLKCVIFPSS